MSEPPPPAGAVSTEALLDRELHPPSGLPRRAASHLLDLPQDPLGVGPLPPLVTMHVEVAAVGRDRVSVLGSRRSRRRWVTSGSKSVSICIERTHSAIRRNDASDAPAARLRAGRA